MKSCHAAKENSAQRTLGEIACLRERLIRWYRRHRRRLPWRETADPYAIWVSEVMLQQTQVATVIPYYQRFLEKFPDVESLAAGNSQEVLKCWEGLGYYSRARNLHRAARRVVADHGARLPEKREVFQQLPGVGDYIASAVLSLAFGQPHAVVDGNVKRMLSRVDMIDAAVNRAPSHRFFKQAADVFLDREDPGLFNQAVMELGALVCKPAKPRCADCPLTPFCRAYAVGRVEDYPRRERRPPVPLHLIAIGVVRDAAGRMLITRRAPDGLLGGLWEFPGGKILAGETPEAACIREIREETGLTVEISCRLARVRHAYTHFKIAADIFVCDRVAGQVALCGPVDYRWVRMEEIDAFPLPKANHKFIPVLRRFVAAASQSTA